MTPEGLLTEARKGFHAALLESILRMDRSGIPSNADKDSARSTEIARRIIEQLGQHIQGARLAGQMSGNKFEVICAEFLEVTFPNLGHLRPGQWRIEHVGGRNRFKIASCEQYAHLIALDRAAKENAELAAALGSDYTISPDIIITRMPEDDRDINGPASIVDKHTAHFASLRAENNSLPILHASISCKWTIRSDRAQNARSEGLNLVRNRKGRLPSIAVVTGEPLPSRIASLALGTGDIDCVYHFALDELVNAVEAVEYEESRELLAVMMDGKRLRDISDLPLDLAI